MNELIDREVVVRLRRILTARVATRFPRLAESGSQLVDLSLRERSDLVSDALLADLPDDYRNAADLFRRSLGDPSFTGWMIWPVTTTAVTLALRSGAAVDFDDCLSLLSELTGRLTAEFAIRRLLEHDLDRALAVIAGWTREPDEHVRRLASEGTRPFLPWAIRVRAVIDAPGATVPILNALYRDESDYVRRSVANHLNDLSRLAPELVLSIAAEWLQAPDSRTVSVVRHGLRTLVKRGNPRALALLGFTSSELSVLSVSELTLDDAVVGLPGVLGFGFQVTNDGAVASRVAIDYVVSFRKGNGTLADKVFKLVGRTLQPGETAVLRRTHSIRQMTTRVHYPGEHRVALQINGVRYAAATFEVV